MGNSVFSLQPTFTQGLLIGQLSVFLLFAFVLKYLFLEPQPHPPDVLPDSDSLLSPPPPPAPNLPSPLGYNLHSPESIQWFNVLLLHVTDAYRAKLGDHLPTSEGDHRARQRMQDFLNSVRPPAFLGPIKILSIDLGTAAPRLSNARVLPSSSPDSPPSIEFDATYSDSLSVSLTTSVLFNLPVPAFARLPVSLNISLSSFSSKLTLTPPDPSSSTPTLTVTLPRGTASLELHTTSLMGSRAKLADVPKLHELIQSQARRFLDNRGPWHLVLPGLASVDEVKAKVDHDYEQQRQQQTALHPQEVHTNTIE